MSRLTVITRRISGYDAEKLIPATEGKLVNVLRINDQWYIEANEDYDICDSCNSVEGTLTEGDGGDLLCNSCYFQQHKDRPELTDAERQQ